ncbi:glycosyltransferase family 4 protein [Kocuria sp. TGY1127_2]|uniref:glycosyltransferase family 4 protein n=1 Tax=Kocuria sp. TGY1127_2 TaxID=2711328 RepID=UPI0015BD3B18|nr:glycosyltransferase family 4 protein [Kocuria sp. TGY1127_2]
MKILLVTHYYRPEIGAPQRRWDSFVKHWLRDGHEVTVITALPHYPIPRHTASLRRGTKAFSPQKGVYGETVIRLPYFSHGYGIVSRTVDHFVVAGLSVVAGIPLARHRYDAVIVTVPALASLIPGHLASWVFRAPLIIEMRDAWPDLVTYTGGIKNSNGLVAKARAATHNLVTRSQIRSKHVVTTSFRFADVLRSRGAEHVTVIRNGADLEAIPVTGRPHFRRGRLKVLYLGTLGRSQGLGAVIDAAGMAAAGGVDIELRLVGDGVAREQLIERARESQASISILDMVRPEEVWRHYEWADTVVVSLTGWAPFEWTVPSKLYEVLATNRHVSAMLAGEAAQIVRESGAGFVCEPGDSKALGWHWVDMAQDPSRMDHGDAGREWVRNQSDSVQLSDEYLDVVRATTCRSSG